METSVSQANEFRIIKDYSIVIQGFHKLMILLQKVELGGDDVSTKTWLQVLHLKLR
jgi:hypothetical protein